ncbi:Hypothetical protein PHPALM_8709 [Phytophthora palmivora]|uniref:Uncharacterized protein n=1 Tax=Phytophthora palmivora TaxID=4796 RepID=A0A2P4Y955_9STRA|nr:Hypothetical protein PHPALM_8709 [Phytophthora palmivora]
MMDRTLALTIHLDGPDDFKYYWHDMRQPARSYIRRQNCGGSVMVWGGFSAEVKSEGWPSCVVRKFHQDNASFTLRMKRRTSCWKKCHYYGMTGLLTGLQSDRERLVGAYGPSVFSWAPTTAEFPYTGSLGNRNARAAPSGRQSKVSGDQFAVELNTNLGLKASRSIQRVDHLVYTKMDRTRPLTAAYKAAKMEWAEVHMLNPDTFLNFVVLILLARHAQTNAVVSVTTKWRRKCRGQKGVSAKGYQNSDDYIYTISDYMLSFACSNRGTDFVFQVMRRFTHPVKRRIYFKEMEVETMVWPARSSDCNPIENVCSVMAARVCTHGRQYSTDQVEDVFQTVWDSIEQAYLLKLVKSMPLSCGNKKEWWSH